MFNFATVLLIIIIVLHFLYVCVKQVHNEHFGLRYEYFVKMWFRIAILLLTGVKSEYRSLFEMININFQTTQYITKYYRNQNCNLKLLNRERCAIVQSVQV